MDKISIRTDKSQRAKDKFTKNSQWSADIKLLMDNIKPEKPNSTEFGKFWMNMKSKIDSIKQNEEWIASELESATQKELKAEQKQKEEQQSDVVVNKYNLVWKDIKDMKLNLDFRTLEAYKDFEWNQNGFYQLRMVSDGFKPVNFEDFSWSNGNFACINFYSDGHIDYLLDCDEMYSYNPTKFLDPKEIETPADKNIQEKVLMKLNWLLDNNIVTSPKVKQSQPSNFRFERGYANCICCWDLKNGDYVAFEGEGIDWKKHKINMTKITHSIHKAKNKSKAIEKFIKALETNQGWKITKSKKVELIK